jgi:hypothetical protein
MTSNLDALLHALSTSSPLSSRPPGSLGNALFVGSGDSLSACLLAERAGHRAASAGDVAWTGSLPPRIDTLVAVSQSGRTAATVAAVTAASERGLHTIAVTTDPHSAITAAAGEVHIAHPIAVTETIPAAGFLSLAAAVLALLKIDTTGGLQEVATRMSAMVPEVTALAAQLPPAMPAAISILTLPDMRAAGDFWSLKLIEATGLAVRSVPLEESGHVDYFIGPQPHLTINLIGECGVARHERLASALAANGHATLGLRAPHGNGWATELAVAALGAYLAEEAAGAWDRPPFRNHEVPMDARHIQL